MTTLEDDEFMTEFNDEMNYTQIMEQMGLYGGTCQLENSILYHKRNKDKTISNLQFRHYIIDRATDHQHINHFTLVYLQNGKLYMESRANNSHRKIHFGKWCKVNTIVSSKVFEPYQVLFDDGTVE